MAANVLAGLGQGEGICFAMHHAFGFGAEIEGWKSFFDKN